MQSQILLSFFYFFFFCLFFWFFICYSFIKVKHIKSKYGSFRKTNSTIAKGMEKKIVLLMANLQPIWLLLIAILFTEEANIYAKPTPIGFGYVNIANQRLTNVVVLIVYFPNRHVYFLLLHG